MDNEFAKHEIDYITRYEEKGFTASFIFKTEKLVETVSKNSYKPEQIFVVEERRFEGMSNPSDSSLLYIIETNDGKKGTFLVAYGPQADIEIAEFFKAIPSGNYINKK
ncbi:hypothetical protein [Aurantibacter sp.]|uniref:hypothetical protein n=1 Tax=Aurantibacter sp. TaxID=2807103 RepID=UPI00326660B9